MAKDAASVPDIEYVRVSPSASEAVMVPTAVWFSFTLKTESDMTGLLSFKFLIKIASSCFTLFSPSETVTDIGKIFSFHSQALS